MSDDDVDAFLEELISSKITKLEVKGGGEPQKIRCRSIVQLISGRLDKVSQTRWGRNDQLRKITTTGAGWGKCTLIYGVPLGGRGSVVSTGSANGPVHHTV